MAEVVEEAAVALPKAVEASKAEVVEAFKTEAEEEEALVEEAVEVFKAAVVDLMEAVVVAVATEVAEVISLKLKLKPHFSESFCCKITLPRYFNLCLYYYIIKRIDFHR